MRITEITVFSYDAMYIYGTYQMSGGRTALGHPSIVVRLRTDEGLEGWSESAPLGSDYLPSSFTGELAALKELGGLVLGSDPRAPAVLSAAMDRAMMGGNAAKAVIDFACWDVFGKSVGLPTYALLGGGLSENLRAFTIVGFGDPETGVKKALAEFEKGVTAMQLKVGDDPVNDARRIRAIREALPETAELWADANCGWNLEQAMIYAKVLGEGVCVPLEQPCRALSDCAEVGRRTGIPIILDECIVTVVDLIAAHAAGVTGVNIKPSRVGGFTKARVLHDTAVALDMMVNVDDTWGCALLMAQNVQLAASTRRDRLRAVDAYSEWTVPLIADCPRMQQDGRYKPTTIPGNGYKCIKLEILGEPIFQMTE
ncbi:hypothetical protein QQS21_003813 [Conoideocrella luteorostrata]|uniref:Mandelate racemase/muconate lactonizing enzyme C-terminal domain-containing protein n=1 Tax=Conoideocrella luteorostrata TaxID=1105319 RepID=A0AAJ0CVD6_9HYPO|nr:hypothetical protein QQS21_003813 [Conoideocrella luteorostrata]